MAAMTVESTRLFDERANEYAQFRPGYPAQVFAALPPETISAVAADIGAGTGIFSRGLLEAGYKVFSVEPNVFMRNQAFEALQSYPGFSAVSGNGECTTLQQSSVDLVTIAQAFHWLDRRKARDEFVRIGKPHFRVAVVWNSRTFGANDFMKAYENLLIRFCPLYVEMKSSYWSDLHRDVRDFYGSTFEKTVFPNTQYVTSESMQGNLRSLSYAPRESDPSYKEFVRHAEELFRGFEKGGLVPFGLQTYLYLGELA